MPHAVARLPNLLMSRHTVFATHPGFTPAGCRTRPRI
jgi:hypothetical protein